ncbi:MAG: hypothetical protein ACK5PB_00630 [Pirellula sp.]
MGIDDHLDDFARGIGGRTWKDLAKHTPEKWRSMFNGMLYDGKTKFTFNLDGVDIWGGVSRASRGAGGATDWELLQIKLTKECWDRITWIKNGQVVPNPFQ